MSWNGWAEPEPKGADPEIRPEEEDTGQERKLFTLISVEDYYDLLMKQQEQM